MGRQFEHVTPANEVCEGYVFTPVCQLFCSQGGVSASVHPGIHPPEQTPPRSRHPPGVDTPMHPHCAVHAGRYGQQAGGTHPTGMHSCRIIVSIQNIVVTRVILISFHFVK